MQLGISRTQVLKLTSASIDLHTILQSCEPEDDADLLAALDERLILAMLFKWGNIVDKADKQDAKKPGFEVVTGFGTLKCTYLKEGVPGTRIFFQSDLAKAAGSPLLDFELHL